MIAMEEPSMAGRLSPLLRAGQKVSPKDAAEVVALVRESRGPQRALEQARSLAANARRELETIDGDRAVKTLSALTNYVVTRKL